MKLDPHVGLNKIIEALGEERYRTVRYTATITALTTNFSKGIYLLPPRIDRPLFIVDRGTKTTIEFLEGFIGKNATKTMPVVSEALKMCRKLDDRSAVVACLQESGPDNLFVLNINRPIIREPVMMVYDEDDQVIDMLKGMDIYDKVLEDIKAIKAKTNGHGTSISLFNFYNSHQVPLFLFAVNYFGFENPKDNGWVIYTVHGGAEIETAQIVQRMANDLSR